MRRLVVLLIGGTATLMVGCGSANGPRSRSDFWTEKAYARWAVSCRDGAEGRGMKPWQAAPLCERYGQPRIFRGIFIQEFEGNQFLEGMRPAPQYREPSETVWLTLDSSSDGPALARLRGNQGETTVWYVVLKGRKTLDRNLGHEHMGVFDQEILVNDVVSAQKVQSFEGYAGPDLLVRQSLSSDNRR